MKCLVLFVTIFLFGNLSAQENTYRHIEDIKFVREDNQGFLYLVSNESICKFDGTAVLDNCLDTEYQISDAIILSDDEYYVAVGEKLMVFKNRIKRKEFVLDDVITSLKHSDDNILIGTGKGLFMYSLKSKTLSDVIVKGFINGITELGEYIYVINDLEIYRIGEDLEYIKSESLPELLPKQIISYDVDKMAILMNSGNIFFVDQDCVFTHKFISKEFKPLEISGEKGLLYAIDDHQLKEWKNDAFESFKEGNFESLTQVQSLLFTTSKNTVASYDIMSTFHDVDKTFSVCSDNGKIWLGREGKISVFENGSIVMDIALPDAFKDTYVSSILINEGHIYAGTMGKGIIVYDLKKETFSTRFSNENTNPSEQNIIKLQSLNNMLWVGYLNGLKVFDINTEKVLYDFTDSLENNYLYSFLAKDVTDIYLGTSDNGLVHIRNKKTEFFFKDHSVYAIVDTPYGIVFSVEGQGVFLLRDGTTTKLNDQYFFRSKDIYNILYKDGIILFSHNQGIDLLDFDNKHIAYISNENFGEPHLNANTTNASNCFIVYDNGLASLQNELITELPSKELILKPPTVFDREVASQKKQFKHTENVWSFSFQSLNYKSPKDKSYKYRLIPLETNWKTTNQEKVTYYDLPPGDYSFEVSTGGNRNFKPLHIKSYTFSIAKPFWTTVWFWLIVLSVLFFLIYIFIKFREKQILKKEQLKSAQIQYEYQRIKDQVNPHFLFNSFNSLIGIVENNPKRAKEVLEKLSSMYRTILKYEKTDIISLSKDIELAKQYFEIHKIRYQDLIELKIDTIKQADKKYIIPLTIQLLIENAIKHNIINRRSRLEIHIYDDDNFLAVSNNVNEKNKKASSLGLGLNNLIRRSEMILNKKPIVEHNDNFFIVKIPYANE